MSDYMFILESHLSAEQNAALGAIQAMAAEANISLFLAGGAMRDMLAGFPIRDLDFTIEGPALKLARDLAKKAKAEILNTDDHRKSAELRFPSGVTCEIAMTRTEKHGKPGTRPHVSPASIHEDLRGRDFTMNAIALSLNRASRGLLIDPTNGAADIERREIRACGNYGLFDDPIRLFRLLRFKARMSFEIEERTASQFRNALEAGMVKHVSPRALFAELRQITIEAAPGEVLRLLEEEGLLRCFSPALRGACVNHAGFQKLAKCRAMIPFGAAFPVDWYALTMFLLTQKLTAKERAALVAATKMSAAESAPWQAVEARARKLETALKPARLSKASLVYQLLKKSPGEDILLAYLSSSERIVQDRIRNFLSKYLATAMDVTDAEVAEVSGYAPGDAKFAKAKEERIAAHLDGRVRKPAPPPEPPPPPEPVPGARRGPGRPPRRALTPIL